MRRHVLVTRPASQAAELATELERRDITATCVATVAIDADSCASALDTGLARLGGASWLVITSTNGAHAVARSVARGTRLPPSARVAAVGSATAAALRAAGLRVDHVPSVYRTVAIADGLGNVRGQRVVLARADAATPALRDALERRGAIVEEIVAYRTVEAPPASRDLLHAALQRDLNAVAFTSSSTVRGLVALASTTDRARIRTLASYCIGPVTATTAHEHGFHVAAVAATHTAAGLADAIAAHLGAPS
jgi:uroporphyrinogen III methyltransferase / synthase